MTHPVVVLGTGIGLHSELTHGHDMLSPDQLQLLAKAELLIGGATLLARFGSLCPQARHLALGGPQGLPFASVCEATRAAWEAGTRVVALADGDPLYFGLGASLARIVPTQALHIFPGISSLQTACARLCLPWSGLSSVSLHGRSPLHSHSPLHNLAPWQRLAAAIRRGEPVCVLGDAHNGPAPVARWLLERGVDWLRMYVFAELNTPHERQLSLSLPEAAAESELFTAPTLILVPEGHARVPKLQLDPQLPQVDAQLITKGPVRACALAALDLAPDDTVWDIGAGSGSVAFGAAALAWNGQVWAVEQEPERLAMVHANRAHVAALNVELVAARAPDGLDNLPDPHAVFVGGGLGGASAESLLTRLYSRLRPGGRLVAACVLLSSLERLRSFAREQDCTLSLTLVQSADSAPLAEDLYFQAHNPVFVVCVKKPYTV